TIKAAVSFNIAVRRNFHYREAKTTTAVIAYLEKPAAEECLSMFTNQVVEQYGHRFREFTLTYVYYV
ncbi:hypothetical protein HDV02_000601, partial [Globomyces sp. JEL0801]